MKVFFGPHFFLSSSRPTADRIARRKSDEKRPSKHLAERADGAMGEIFNLRAYFREWEAMGEEVR